MYTLIGSSHKVSCSTSEKAFSGFILKVFCAREKTGACTPSSRQFVLSAGPLGHTHCPRSRQPFASACETLCYGAALFVSLRAIIAHVAYHTCWRHWSIPVQEPHHPRSHVTKASRTGNPI